MENMSLLAPVFVLIEMFRPLLPWLTAIVLADLALLVLAYRRRPLRGVLAVKLALGIAGVVALFVFFALPAATHASLADLTGIVDYLVLLAASVGMGGAVGLLSLPLLLAVSGRSRVRSPGSAAAKGPRPVGPGTAHSH